MEMLSNLHAGITDADDLVSRTACYGYLEVAKWCLNNASLTLDSRIIRRENLLEGIAGKMGVGGQWEDADWLHERGVFLLRDLVHDEDLLCEERQHLRDFGVLALRTVADRCWQRYTAAIEALVRDDSNCPDSESILHWLHCSDEVLRWLERAYEDSAIGSLESNIALEAAETREWRRRWANSRVWYHATRRSLEG